MVNLSELAPVTAENIVPHMIDAFEKVYGSKSVMMNFEGISARPEVKAIFDEMSGRDWLFGKWKEFRAQKSAQFDWGMVELEIDVDQEHSIIKDIKIASDGLDLASIELAKKILIGADTTMMPPLPEVKEKDVIQDILNMVY